jgi:tetratricopeptide (TPR) repeat protein/DNA-binding CsgD family transcriptional regulator/uncharacterized membrane-anchored protein YhcB (DUF1043 family)
MPVQIHKILLMAVIFISFQAVKAQSFEISGKDTAQVNYLLRNGRNIHYSNPDSAIYYYSLIHEKMPLKPGDIDPQISGLEKAFLETYIRSLNFTGNIYYYNDEYNRSEPYYRRSLELAKRVGLKEYEGKALYDIGYIRYVNNRYKDAVELFEKSYQLYNGENNKAGMYNVCQACGLALRKLGDFDNADSSYADCLRIATELNDSMMIADAKLNSGILLCERGNMEEGIHAFEVALSYYEQIGHQGAVSTALLNIGVVLKMVNEYDKALSYIAKSTEIEELQQQKSELVVRYYNMADLYLDMGEYEKAYDYCKKLQSVAQEIGSRPFEAECNFLMGKYYYLQEDYKLSGQYFEKASGSTGRTNNKPLTANINLWHARTFLKEEKYGLSISKAMEAYQIADELNLLLIQKEASALLSEANEKSGKTREALAWYKTYLAHSDSLSYFNQQQEINRIEASFNYEKKEKENEILRNQASLQEQKLRIRNIISIALVTGVALSLVIILLLMRKNRYAKLLYEHKQMINVQHLQEIEGELDGKKRELASKLLFLNQKNELITRLIKRLQEIQQSPDNSNDELVSIVNELRIDAPQSNWKEFETQFTQVHPGFYQRLYEKHPELTSYEQRICAFLRMNLNTKEISAITGRSAKSIEVTRSRIRHKLNLQRDGNLSSFLAAV